MNTPRSLSLPPNASFSLPPNAADRAVLYPPPSFGFWFLTASILLACGFFGWAASTPQLEDAFKVLSRREHDDFAVYSESEVQILSQTLDRYPDFVRALLGRRSTARLLEPTAATNGWLTRPLGHLALRNNPAKALVLSVEAKGLLEDFPLEVAIDYGNQQDHVSFDKPMTKNLTVKSQGAARPTIATVKVRAASTSSAKQAPTWGIRIDSESLPPTETSP